MSEERNVNVDFDAKAWCEKFGPVEGRRKPAERRIADGFVSVMPGELLLVRRANPIFAIVTGMGIGSLACFLGFRIGQGHDYSESIFAFAAFLVGAAYAFCQDD